MLERQLPFAHVRDSSFIHQRVADRPGVARIVLLASGSNLGTETRNVGARCLEVVEGLKLVIVGVVIVEAEILTRVNVVVEADSELILPLGLHRYRLIRYAVRPIGPRNEPQQVHRNWILAGGGDHVGRKYAAWPAPIRARRRSCSSKRVNGGRAAGPPVQCISRKLIGDGTRELGVV